MKTYTIEEVCAILIADRNTVLALADCGDLPGAKIGRAWVFTQKDVAQYLADRVKIQTAERKARTAADKDALGRSRNKSESVTKGLRRKRNYPALPDLPGESVGQAASA